MKKSTPVKAPSRAMSSGTTKQSEIKNDIAKVVILKEFSADATYLKGTKNSLNRAKVKEDQASEAFVEGVMGATVAAAAAPAPA